MRPKQHSQHKLHAQLSASYLTAQSNSLAAVK